MDALYLGLGQSLVLYAFWMWLLGDWGILTGGYIVSGDIVRRNIGGGILSEGILTGRYYPVTEQDNDKTTTRQRQDNGKTNVEPVHSYDAFHTRSEQGQDKPDVKGIIGMHRFNIFCRLLGVLSLSCSGV